MKSYKVLVKTYRGWECVCYNVNKMYAESWAAMEAGHGNEAKVVEA